MYMRGNSLQNMRNFLKFLSWHCCPKSRFFHLCAISQSSHTQKRYCFIQAWVLGGFSTNQTHPLPTSSLHLYIKFMHILSMQYISILIYMYCATMWCHCSWLFFRLLCTRLPPFWGSLLVLGGLPQMKYPNSFYLYMVTCHLRTT